jgi:uracil-DNA glycosylase
MSTNVDIEASWKEALNDQWEQPYFISMAKFLKEEKQKGKVIYPKGSKIFSAFEITPFNQVKIVILGQDPYHGPGQAMGLSFSVPKGVKVPASLKRIYKELHRDIGFEIPEHGDLTSWAEQGVFLLNAMLTVEASQPGSHKKIGWQNFTDAVIRKLSNDRKGIIFMLWGNFAKAKKSLINTEIHHVLEAAHPSPLAGNAFSECSHFSKANNLLREMGAGEINWQL